MFEVHIEPESTHTLVHLRGDLTSATAPQLETALAGLLAGGSSRLLLDLQQLAFSSSAGLRVFLSYAKKIKNAGGRLVLCAVQPAVFEVLETSGFTQILSIAATTADGRHLVASA